LQRKFDKLEEKQQQKWKTLNSIKRWF